MGGIIGMPRIGGIGGTLEMGGTGGTCGTGGTTPVDAPRTKPTTAPCRSRKAPSLKYPTLWPCRAWTESPLTHPITWPASDRRRSNSSQATTTPDFPKIGSIPLRLPTTYDIFFGANGPAIDSLHMVHDARDFEDHLEDEEAS